MSSSGLLEADDDDGYEYEIKMITYINTRSYNYEVRSTLQTNELIINSVYKTWVKWPSAKLECSSEKNDSAPDQTEGRRKKRCRWKNMIYRVKNVETHAKRNNGESAVSTRQIY